MKRLRALIPALLATVLGAAGLEGAWWGWNRHLSASRQERPQLAVTARARSQELLITVDQTGPLSTRDSDPISPGISGVLTAICDNGILVQKGDVIAVIDPVRMLREYKRQRESLAQRERNLKQAKQERDFRLAALDLKLKQAQDDAQAFAREQSTTLRESLQQMLFRAEQLRQRRRDLDIKQRLAAQGLIPGTEVEREQAALKADEFALQTERTKLALDMSQAKARILERNKAVDDTRADRDSEKRQADTQVRMAENEVENSRMRLKQMAEELKNTLIRAPRSGIVILDEDPQPGEMVWHGRELGKVVSLEGIQVMVELTQSQVVEVQTGQQVLIQVDALPDRRFAGRVINIGKTARRPSLEGAGWWQRAETTFPVTISINKPDPRLRPGMRANVRIVTLCIKNAVTIPSECVFRRQGKPVVYLQKGKRFVPVFVDLGRSNGNYVVVRRGLRPGDRVVLNDVSRLVRTPTRSGGKP